MGLRLREGIDLKRFERLFGAPLITQLDVEKLDRLVKGGFLEQGKTSLVATANGRQCLNAVLTNLLT